LALLKTAEEKKTEDRRGEEFWILDCGLRKEEEQKGRREQRGLDMDKEKLVQMKQWVEAWRRAGIELERIRQAELPLISTTQVLQNLSGAFEFARRHFTLKPYSGLVEQQAWFKKYREKGV
jgi:hypothetical protein